MRFLRRLARSDDGTSTVPFRARTAKRVLARMLREAGVDPDRPQSISVTWEVFKRFMNLPSDAVGPDADGFLYQSGTFRFYGPEEFYVDFVRQFGFGSGGEHDHYEQLHCEFRFAPTDATRAFGQHSQWWFPDSGSDSGLFIGMVEGRPEFAALRDAPPLAVAIHQEAV